jgi:hypothetical protein
VTGRVPSDRWTCPHPDCGQTVAPDTGNDVTLARAIRDAQLVHGKRHRGGRP